MSYSMTNKQGTERCCKECLEYIEINHIMGGIDTIEICTNKKCVCHSPQGDTPEDWKSEMRKYWNEESTYTEQKYLTPDTWGILYEGMEKIIHKLQQEAYEKGREAERKESVEMLTKYPQKIYDLYGGKMPWVMFEGTASEDEKRNWHQHAFNDVIKLITQRGSK